MRVSPMQHSFFGSKVRLINNFNPFTFILSAFVGKPLLTKIVEFCKLAVQYCGVQYCEAG